jgi:hypothetical protein
MAVDNISVTLARMIRDTRLDSANSELYPWIIGKLEEMIVNTRNTRKGIHTFGSFLLNNAGMTNITSSGMRGKINNGRTSTLLELRKVGKYLKLVIGRLTKKQAHKNLRNFRRMLFSMTFLL